VTRAAARRGEPRTGLVLGVLGLAAVAAAAAAPPRRRPRPRARQGAALLATSVLLDSALEHFRGEYHRPAMFIAPAMGAATLAAAVSPGRVRALRRSVFGAAILTGLVGNWFHLRQIARRPGGFSWEGLFYAAPVGAPGALSLAGLAGLGAGATRHTPRRLAALTIAGGLLATTAEIALLHFRGAFHERAMYAPLILPPAAALALACAARDATPRATARARSLLRATATLGAVGIAFHARGIARQMGGWRNWSQNLQSGPPLPAPPGLTGAALAGLAAVDLLEEAR
jgi:hypothetical protein